MQNKKNILLMVPGLSQGGQEKICLMTARLLAQDCNVSVAVFDYGDGFYDASGIDVVNLDLKAKPSKLGKVLNLFKRIQKTKKLKKEKNIDITYSFGPSANLANIFSTTKGKIWVGLRAYGGLLDKTMKVICKKSDMMIACSKVMEEDIARLYQVKETMCLYNPCDVDKIRELAMEPIEEEYQPFFSGDGPIVVSMGREDVLKGFWHLFKAFALVKKEIPNAKLMIVGNGEFTAYKKLAEELGFLEDVLFTGAKTNPFKYLRQSTVYAMSSLSEGFPNALVEAMAVGLPVVSTNCKSGPAEILCEDFHKASDQSKVYEGEYGILTPTFCETADFDAAKVEEEEKIFSEKLLCLLKDKELQKRMGEAAYKRSENFSLNRYKDNLLDKIKTSVL